MILWEYREDKDLSNKAMNKLGAEGWELAAVCNEECDADVINTIYTFKRPLQIPPAEPIA